MLNREHSLVELADKIDWPRFDAVFADSHIMNLGVLGKAIRLMVGLQCLKDTVNESDESGVGRWAENPYWQYVCGSMDGRHEDSFDLGSMCRGHERVGARRLKRLLQEAVDPAVREKQLPP